MTYAKPPGTADDSITMSVKDFCRVTGIGPGLVYKMIEDGRLASFLVSPKYRLIVMDSYRRYVAEQARISPHTPPSTAHRYEGRVVGSTGKSWI